jgi:hypothetical protein
MFSRNRLVTLGMRGVATVTVMFSEMYINYTNLVKMFCYVSELRVIYY